MRTDSTQTFQTILNSQHFNNSASAEMVPHNTLTYHCLKNHFIILSQSSLKAYTKNDTQLSSNTQQ